MELYCQTVKKYFTKLMTNDEEFVNNMNRFFNDNNNDFQYIFFPAIIPMAYLCWSQNNNIWNDILHDNADEQRDYLYSSHYYTINEIGERLARAYYVCTEYNGYGDHNRPNEHRESNIRKCLFNIKNYDAITSFYDPDGDVKDRIIQSHNEQQQIECCRIGLEAVTNRLTADSNLYDYAKKLYRISHNDRKAAFRSLCKTCFDLPEEVFTDPESDTAKEVLKEVNRINRIKSCNKKRRKIKENAENEPYLLMSRLYTKVNGGVKQIILHGAPGTGKSHTVNKFTRLFTYEEPGRVKTVQFHPTFDYTDLVEGLRPVTLGDDKAPTFVRLDGILKEFCRTIVEEQRAKPDDPDIKKKQYFFVIDEINRADLSKVLGDLMYLMNDASRTRSDGENPKVQTPYRNLPTYHRTDDGKFVPYTKEEDVFCDGFYLPDNLYIIGTMNDIDRSVDIFDFALRRRFCFIEANADKEAQHALPDMLGKGNEEKAQEALKRLTALNAVITEGGKKLGLSSDYHIGHAYLGNIAKSSYEDVWENNICPLIREYCRGRSKEDAEKFEEKCKDKFTGKSASDTK